jgi:diguanylate cyclase (GGDEF)-like protein
MGGPNKAQGNGFMTESLKVFYVAIVITGLVVLMTTAGSILFLYHTAVGEQKLRLLEMVKTQANLIEVVHANLSLHGDDMSLEAHTDHSNELREIFNKLSRIHPLSASGPRDKEGRQALNFYIAEKRGDYAHFHAGTKRLLSQPTPCKNLLGKPMGMALEGQTGVLKTKDHMGHPILSAFTYVKPVGLGIVAKILLNDLRRPFIKTAVITYAGALVLFLLSGLIMKNAVSPLVEKLEKQQAELEKKNRNLYKQATTDNLTELFNRQHFNEQLTNAVARAKRYNQPVALIIFDIDHFKQINDTLGHLAGDSVLKELAKLIRTRIRSSDILARWGGEEFVILLTETDKDIAYAIAQKLRTEVSQYTFSIRQEVTCSFGVTLHKVGESTTDLIRRADEGLYEAKANGRNRVVFK